jgi:hypothetical protein
MRQRRDLASLQQMRSVADQVNALGIFAAIIHNAAVGYREPQRVETEDCLMFFIGPLPPLLAACKLLIINGLQCINVCKILTTNGLRPKYCI